MTLRSLCAAAILLLASPVVLANASKPALILQEQHQIREELENSDGAYARFQPRARERMFRAQETVFRLLEGVSSVEQLHPRQRTDLFNALQTIEAVIAANELDRQVCRREPKLGTHMRVTRCATVAERRRIEQGAQDWKGEPSVCGVSSRRFGPECRGNLREVL